MITAVTTNKGGSLKTSIVTNLAAIYAKEGLNVLIIDTDNQGNAALTFGLNPDQMSYTLYDVLTKGVKPSKAIYEVSTDLHLLPANDEMAFFEFDILASGNQDDRDRAFYRMRDTLADLENEYDVILIDTPPNIGLVQGNVLTFARDVLIPFQPEHYSMRSLVKILEAVESFREHNPALRVRGVVGTLVDPRTVLHRKILDECRVYCDGIGIPMLNTIIPRSIQFANSVAYENEPLAAGSRVSAMMNRYYDIREEIGHD